MFLSPDNLGPVSGKCGVVPNVGSQLPQLSDGNVPWLCSRQGWPIRQPSRVPSVTSRLALLGMAATSIARAAAQRFLGILDCLSNGFLRMFQHRSVADGQQCRIKL